MFCLLGVPICLKVIYIINEGVEGNKQGEDRPDRNRQS